MTASLSSRIMRIPFPVRGGTVGGTKSTLVRISSMVWLQVTPGCTEVVVGVVLVGCGDFFLPSNTSITWYEVCGPKCWVPSSWYPLIGTRNLVIRTLIASNHCDVFPKSVYTTYPFAFLYGIDKEQLTSWSSIPCASSLWFLVSLDAFEVCSVALSELTIPGALADASR